MKRNIHIEGIRPTNSGRWAVVGTRYESTEDSGPGDYDTVKVTVLVNEYATKREAIIASGTNRVVA